MTPDEQTLLLKYFAIELTGTLDSTNLRAGAPHSFTVTHSAWALLKGKTLGEIVQLDQKKGGNGGESQTRSQASGWLEWICRGQDGTDRSFVWHFPKSLGLYLAVLGFVRSSTSILSKESRRSKLTLLTFSTQSQEAYTRFCDSILALSEDDLMAGASTADEMIGPDAVLDESFLHPQDRPFDKHDHTFNHVPDEQRTWFAKKVEDMEKFAPFNKWDSCTLHPPDPTCLTTGFDSSLFMLVCFPLPSHATCSLFHYAVSHTPARNAPSPV